MIPILVAQFESKNRLIVTFVGTHLRSPVTVAHSRSRNEQLKSITRFISCQSNTVVLLGDPHVTAWYPMFQDLLANFWIRKSMKCMGFRLTWPTNFPLALIPIDHWLILSEEMIHSPEMSLNVESDYFYLVVDFQVYN